MRIPTVWRSGLPRVISCHHESEASVGRLSILLARNPDVSGPNPKPMKRTTTTVKSRHYQRCFAIGVAALFFGVSIAAHANQTIRELWDGSGKTPLAGKGSDFTSVGLDNSTTWVVSPAGNTGIQWDSSWNLDGWLGIDENTVLTDNGGNGGTFAFYGGNMSTLTNPVTSLPYGNYYSQCYATRALATNAYINCASDATYYFSVRMFRGYAAWSWTADVAAGFGFASSNATNADFVGAGFTRNSPFYMAGGTNDVGNSSYITTGTLNQAGTGNNVDPISGLDTDGGPYYPRAAGAVNLFTDAAGLLVGQLTTTASGAATMKVKLYPPNTGPYPSDPSAITWDASYSFTDTNVMTQLLVWAYGGGTGVQDALRVGTTWGDVIGLEAIGAPQATPASTVYAGTTVTLSQNADLNSTTYPMSLQWYSNSVAILNATNSSLVLANTTVDFTADYSIVVSNYFGELTNLVHVTFNPGVPPLFTAEPVSITRCVNGTANFTVGVDGTPPFSFQLNHAGTNLPGVVSQLSAPGTTTLTYGPIALTDAGLYSVTATNSFGSTNSQTVTLTEFAPASGSFEAAAVAAGAAAFWRLTESTNDLTTNGLPLHEYMSGLDGNCPDTNNMSFGVAGPDLPGFAGLTSIETENNGNSSQINLAGMTDYSNTMSMVFWMDVPYLGHNALMMDMGNGQAGGGGSQPFYGIDYRGGSLGSQWGSTDSMWNSGITLPQNQWIMVALVVEPNETIVYAGTDPFTLQSTSRSSVEGTNYSNISGTLPVGRLALGRSDFSWAQYNNSWAGDSAIFSDAAVFYKALTPSTITNLYVAGFGTGVRISGKPDGAGNLILNWYPTLTLQEANGATGPWSDATDSSGNPPTPPYTVPIVTTNAQQFFRVRQ